MKPSRYEGKPLLRLGEFYVLWSIGELPGQDSAQLDAMAPKLAALYGGDGTWPTAVAAALNLPPNLPEVIRQMWDDNRKSNRLIGRTLTPPAFAQWFVDTNSANRQG